MMKKTLFVLLLSLFLVIPEAFAQRTGGRFGGGGGFRSSSSGSGSRVYSPGGGGGFGFFFFPSFGYGGGSIFGGLILLGILYFVVICPVMSVCC
jgi:uncharacterized membrane protein